MGVLCHLPFVMGICGLCAPSESYVGSFRPLRWSPCSRSNFIQGPQGSTRPTEPRGPGTSTASAALFRRTWHLVTCSAGDFGHRCMMVRPPALSCLNALQLQGPVPLPALPVPRHLSFLPTDGRERGVGFGVTGSSGSCPFSGCFVPNSHPRGQTHGQEAGRTPSWGCHDVLMGTGSGSFQSVGVSAVKLLRTFVYKS